MPSFSLDIHRPIEAAIGLALAVIPLLLTVAGGLDMGAISLILAIVIGGVMTTLGFAAGRSGELVSPALHSALDHGLTGALVVATILFALAGEWEAAAIFAVALALFGLLTLRTRYVGENTSPRVR